MTRPRCCARWVSRRRPCPGAAEIAIAQVVDRAAGLATALAAAGGLLAMPGDDPDDDTGRGRPGPNAISPPIGRSGDRTRGEILWRNLWTSGSPGELGERSPGDP